MPKSGIRAIIFDIGRVLIRVDIERAPKGLANGSSLTSEELWSAIQKDPRWKDWQEGRMSPRDWHLNLSNRFGLSLGFEEFARAWNSALDPQPIHPDHMFQHLSKSYRLGLISNTDPIHVAYMESAYSFFRYFPKPVRMYSCVIGTSKPDPLIFRQALNSCKVSAQQTVYVDDIAAFTQAASGLGMYAIQYRSPEQLQNDFRALGINLP